MISKELLIKALGNRWIDATRDRTVEEKFTLTPTGNYILFGYKGYNHWSDSINTYELAHKCKEWALSKEYVISSHSKYKLDGYNCILYCNNGEIDEDFTSDTEPEAIFKACQWILDHKEDN